MSNYLSLETCFDYLVEEEQLGESDAYRCPSCKLEVRAMKKMDIYESPEILIVQLKRFALNRMRRERDDQDVKFDSTLDISPYIVGANNKGKYALQGITAHMGTTDYGHYVAYARNAENNKWYLFDDSRVREVEESHVLQKKSDAYLLWYSRCPDIEQANVVNMD